MICKDNSEFTPSNEQISQWELAFGERLQVQKELQKMESWLNCNPTKRKTQRGMPKFINSWLTRAAARGGSPEITHAEAGRLQVEGFDKGIQDAVYEKVQSTFAYYEKELTMPVFSTWLRALKGIKLPDIEEALDRHVLRCKFAPKVSDVLDLIAEMREEQPEKPRHIAEKPFTPPPPKVSAAWRWYIGSYMQGGVTLFAASEVDQATQEEYLKIVNQEAVRSGQLEAILPEHRLVEYWGATQ